MVYGVCHQQVRVKTTKRPAKLAVVAVRPFFMLLTFVLVICAVQARILEIDAAAIILPLQIRSFQRGLFLYLLQCRLFRPNNTRYTVQWTGRAPFYSTVATDFERRKYVYTLSTGDGQLFCVRSFHQSSPPNIERSVQRAKLFTFSSFLSSCIPHRHRWPRRPTDFERRKDIYRLIAGVTNDSTVLMDLSNNQLRPSSSAESRKAKCFLLLVFLPSRIPHRHTPLAAPMAMCWRLVDDRKATVAAPFRTSRELKMRFRFGFACLRKGCCFRYLSDRHRPATPRPGRGALVPPTLAPKLLHFTLRRSTNLKNRRPPTGSLEMWDAREAVTICRIPARLVGRSPPHRSIPTPKCGRAK
jgi:hypothetical protein